MSAESWRSRSNKPLNVDSRGTSDEGKRERGTGKESGAEEGFDMLHNVGTLSGAPWQAPSMSPQSSRGGEKKQDWIWECPELESSVFREAHHCFNCGVTKVKANPVWIPTRSRPSAFNNKPPRDASLLPLRLEWLWCQDTAGLSPTNTRRKQKTWNNWVSHLLTLSWMEPP